MDFFASSLDCLQRKGCLLSSLVEPILVASSAIAPQLSGLGTVSTGFTLPDICKLSMMLKLRKFVTQSHPFGRPIHQSNLILGLLGTTEQTGSSGGNETSLLTLGSVS